MTSFLSFAIKSSHVTMYKVYFLKVQLPYRFLLLALRSYFEALSFLYAKHVTVSQLESFDENLTSF